ncbi:ATP-binding protein [Streptomyces xiaopingdaonensis]|uniref:ATP-binding protein n=1 Tax=Streptomyces xiaopingdaonensis TaxID=1565415 RepID=UPI0002EDCBE1|nr:ATP-binding protein [Streptomyces xiaopingdaonensis]
MPEGEESVAFTQSALPALVPQQAGGAGKGVPTADAPVLSEGFELPARTEAVARARACVEERVESWGLPEELGYTAQLVISEFFTNAVVHTDSGRVLCCLQIRGDRLRIEVADEGTERLTPQLRRPGVDELGGRGLQLVGAVACEWGVVAGGGAGRIVWAELDSAPERTAEGDRG